MSFVVFLFLFGCTSIQGSLFDMGVASEREQAKLEQRTVEVDGERIHYLEREGSYADAQTIVLVHGFAGDKNHWIRFARFLPPSYRVLALDLPGHGDNAPDTTATYSIPNLTESLTAFLTTVGADSAHVVGNSLGGWLAAELALSHPEQVQTISLLNPGGLRSPEPSTLDLALARGENLLIPTTREQYERFTSIAFGDDPPDLPWPTASVIANRYAERAPLYRRIWADIGSVPNTLETRLSDLTQPLLVVWGNQDGILHVSAATRWGELVPHAEVDIIPGVGHAPMLEQPETTANAILTFIGDR